METFILTIFSRIGVRILASGPWIMGFFTGLLALSEEFARPSKKEREEIRRRQELDNNRQRDFENNRQSACGESEATNHLKK